MTGLKVKGVSKVYKEKTALSPLSFQAEEGECIVLCGGNGAGKSTLLSILAGVLPPTDGTVTLHGVSLWREREQYLSYIGYMPDEFQAPPMMTVWEFLSYYASLRKVPWEQVEETLRDIGLEAQKHEWIKRLSKGMRQRLLFGQSLLGHPALLLLDEPTNGLDPFWIDRFIDILNQRKNEGTIIIFSTHMMDVAADAGDMILFMKNGAVVQRIKATDGESKEQTVWQLLALHRR
ncbi:ABC transporter ATP-binding protein [Geobacillus sp. JS12]|uniref:ABC transporter ATP-binding protein n=1 Tax=Geobacillus sp. JS12 TaxID=1813182 RepID=UPI00078B20CF|nr:ABC transporter ATP-binding protein [Geobacillus sp. JS12]AMQ20874.1 multidrug ABC transporter ATP-binding protein [Geobacillus sp. JS12]